LRRQKKVKAPKQDAGTQMSVEEQALRDAMAAQNQQGGSAGGARQDKKQDGKPCGKPARKKLRR
jgi:hypothetical protein